MKIAILSSSLSRSGGGVSEVALQLSQNLTKLPAVEVEAFGLYDDNMKYDGKLWGTIKTNIQDVVGPASVGYSPSLISALKNSNADLIHLHGLWQYPSYACSKAGIPWLTTIHGMLDQWALKNSGFKKKIAGFFYENAALKKAACLQAFTLQELAEIRQFGLKNPVCIIPNGIGTPKDVEELKKILPAWKKNIPGKKKTLLYLGRIHPKKGLTNLIKAWKKLEEMKLTTNWQLVIAGWDQGGYELDLKILVRHLGVSDSVHFIGPQFTLDKKLAFCHADGFILPSFSEGLPMAVLEAWSFKLPVVMTKHCNLPEGFSSHAAFEISPNIESIIEGLCNLFSQTQSSLHEMGANGNLLVTAKFSWQSVTKQIHEVYEWITNKSIQPQSVVLD